METQSSPATSALVIERAPLPIIEVQGPCHTVSSVSAAFCRLLGKPAHDLVGKPFRDVVPGGESCVPILDQVYETGQGATHAVRDPSDSEPAYWLYAMWPALHGDERVPAAIIQVGRARDPRRDAAEVNEALLLSALRQHVQIEEVERLNVHLQSEIVERQIVESALKGAIAELTVAQHAAGVASRAKDDFLAALSHELRTPLNPALMAAAELKLDDRLPPEVRELLEMIERNISLEARLIDDLLDLTKIANGKLQLRTALCDAHQLIDLAIKIVEGDARARQIAIHRACDAPNPMLVADATRFQQVIWNLLRNAVKFTPPGGKVMVRTRPVVRADGTTWLRIEVTDTGIGIDPNRLEQIFRPFDQGAPGVNQQFGGVGLGLAIARAVIEMHGGRISAESAGSGRGATLVVELPAASGSASPPGNADGPPRLGSTESGRSGLPSRAPGLKRILLVEDHESSAQTISSLLRRDGHGVEVAGTVAGGLAAAAHSGFDIVISDLGLPDGSGLELMKTLRENYGLTGIALSGYGSDADVARSRAAGFKIHLLKPISMVELRAALAS